MLANPPEHWSIEVRYLCGRTLIFNSLTEELISERWCVRPRGDEARALKIERMRLLHTKDGGSVTVVGLVFISYCSSLDQPFAGSPRQEWGLG